MSLKVGEGQLVALLGPNGAGKSSLLSAVMGIVPVQGEIRFEGRSIVGLDPADIVRMGMAIVPEGRRLFTRLTVAENLRLGATARRDAKTVETDIRQVLDRFPILGDRQHDPAGKLSGGQQQQLSIARALLSRPKLLLMDEPSLGLDPISIKRVFEVILELKQEGLALLVADQNAIRATQIADHVYVMRTGAVAHSGSAEELRAEISYESEYLGIEPAAADRQAGRAE